MPARSRVTLVGSRRRVDLELPADTPFIEMVRDVLDLLDEPTDGTTTRVWTVSRLGQDPFPNEQTFEELGVADGDVLYVVNRRRPVPPTRVEDVVEVVQDVVEASPGLWSRVLRIQLALLSTVTAAALLAAYAATWRDAEPAWALVPGGAALALLVTAAVAARHRAGDGLFATYAAVAGLPLMAAAGAVAGGDEGVAGPLVAALVGALAYLAAAAATVPNVRMPAAGTAPAMALAAAAAGTAALGVDPGAVAAGTGFVAALAVGAVPRFAVGVGGLAELDDRAVGGYDVSRTEIESSTAKAHVVLTASLAPLALVICGAFAVLAFSGPGWPVANAAVLGSVVLLRARGFALARHVVPLIVAGGAGVLAAVGAGLDGTAPGVARAVASGSAAVAVVALLVAGAVDLHPSLATRAALFLDRLERLLTVVGVPLLAGHLGLYDAVARRIS